MPRSRKKTKRDLPDATPLREAATVPRKLEALVVGLVLLIGIVQRFAKAEAIAVEHFDEGVYASNLWFDDGYPMRHFYAPPLFPALVEWVMIFAGVNAAVLINAWVGTITIAVVWWVTRRWFGPVAGIVAGTLCATSDFHILYSRTLLTDPLLCLWLITAVGCLAEAHQRRDLKWAIAGGVLTGLAWWTKYNGWLPLAIQTAGVAGWLVCGGPEPRRHLKTHLGLIATSIVVAALIWSPVPAAFCEPGGYSAVAENHSGYLVGLGGWWESVWKLRQVHRYWTGFVTVAGIGFAVLLAALFVSRDDRLRFLWSGGDPEGEPPSREQSNRILWPVAIGFALLVIPFNFVIGSRVIEPFAAIGIAGWLLRSTRIEEESYGSDVGRGVGGWMLAAWFIGLVVATPMYRAYPRLSLPWLVSVWLGTAAYAAAVLSWMGSRGENRTSGPRVFEFHDLAIVTFFGGIVLLLAAILWLPDRPIKLDFPGWQDRTGMRTAADQVLDRIRKQLPKDDKQTPIVIYVYGEPALVHHLSAMTRDAARTFVVRPIDGLRATSAQDNGRPVPTFIVTGPHAHRDKAFEQKLKQASDLLEEIGRPIDARASDLMLLNEHEVREIRDSASRPRTRVRLFRVK